MAAAVDAATRKRVLKVVFISLLLDLVRGLLPAVKGEKANGAVRADLVGVCCAADGAGEALLTLEIASLSYCRCSRSCSSSTGSKV